MGVLDSAERWYWVDANGVATSLHPIDAIRGGLFTSPEVDIEPITDDGGGLVTGVRYPPNRIDVRMAVIGDDAGDFRDKVAALAASMDHEREPDYWSSDVIRPVGRLRVVGHGGVARYTPALYDGAAGADHQYPFIASPTLRFVCPEPYWLAETSTAIGPYTADQTQVESWIPMLPLRLSQSDLVVSQTITNPGHVAAWPIWTITGPGSNPVLRDSGRGLRLALTIDLGIGETLVIDTRRDRRTIKVGSTNKLGTLDTSTEMFPLAAGNTQFALEMNGTDPNSTTVSGEITPRYKTPAS